MKHTTSHRRGVCMLCGKPSKESICHACKSRVQGESLHKKVQVEKSGKTDR